MEFLVSLLAAALVGWTAHRRRRSGLQWGSGVAAVLLATSAALGFYNQAVGVAPYIWWIVAVVVVATAWHRLSAASSPPPLNPASPEVLKAAPDVRSAKSVDVEAPSPAAKKWRLTLGRTREEKLGSVLVLVVVVGVLLGKLLPADSATAAAPAAATSVKASAGTMNHVAVWDCATVRDPSRLWRRMQFDADGVYAYVGDATGTPSWGRWTKPSDSIMRMTVDEDEPWLTWTMGPPEEGKWTMTNNFGLTVICNASKSRLTRPANIPAVPTDTSSQTTPAGPTANPSGQPTESDDPQEAVRQFFTAVEKAKANPNYACQGQASTIGQQVERVLSEYASAMQQMPDGPNREAVRTSMGKAASAGIGSFSPQCLQ